MTDFKVMNSEPLDIKAMRERCYEESRSLFRDILGFLIVRSSTEQKLEFLAKVGGHDGKASMEEETRIFRLYGNYIHDLNPEKKGAHIYIDPAGFYNHVQLFAPELDFQKFLTGQRFHIETVDQALEAWDEMVNADATIEYLDKVAAQLEQIDMGGRFKPNFALELEDIAKEQNLGEIFTAETFKRYDELADFRERHKDELYVPTGFKLLDENIGSGLMRGRVSIIAARPGAGKTLFATNVIANHIKAKTGAKILFFSTEMEAESISKRISVAVGAPPTYEEAMSADITDFLKVSDYGKDGNEGLLAKHQSLVSTYMTDEKSATLMIDDCSAASIDYIEARVLSASISFRPTLVIIDYWQNLTGGEGRDARTQLMDISHRITTLAKKSNAAFLVVCQLRRQPAKGDMPMHPSMDDIAECDQIARDASLIFCLSSMTTEDDHHFRGLEIVKARERGSGIYQLMLCGEVCKFYECARLEDWPRARGESRAVTHADENISYGGGGFSMNPL